MMNIKKFFKKYVHSSVKLFFFFILINIIFFVVLATISGKHGSSNPSKLLKQISCEIQKSETGYFISESTINMLDQQHVWCILIDNQSGEILWDYCYPTELQQNFSYGDLAEITRWYFNDYPVFVFNHEEGLIIIGYPKDSYWKFSAYKTVQSVKVDIIGFVMVFFANIIIVMSLFIFNSKKIEKSIKPILLGIENITAGKKTNLVEQGDLAEINAQLNIVATKLQQRDIARANWIAGISHDIRTPLSMVLGYSSSLEQTGQFNPSDLQKISAIRQQAFKIKRLIEDLNIISKLEYDVHPLHLEKIYPVEIMREVLIDYLNYELDEKYNIDLQIASDCNEITILGDVNLITRLFGNLIRNCIIHNPNGCNIIINVQQGIKSCEFQIIDNGIGITEEKIQQINNGVFFNQSYQTINEIPHGLGLRLVHQIIKAHNSMISFKNVYPHGLCVTIYFPT